MSQQIDVADMTAEELLVRISRDVRTLRAVVVAQFIIAIISFIIALR